MAYLEKNKFAIIAHRGGSLEAPENTFYSFNYSFNLFKEIYFELDVHLTKDGEVVIIHDDSVDRTTNGKGLIFEKSLAEIQNLDAAYRFDPKGEGSFPLRGKGVSIPTLREIFIKFPNTKVSIEVKRNYPEAIEKVIELIRELNAKDRIVLAAGNHKILKNLRQLGPEMCSGYSAKEIYWAVLLHRLKLGTFMPQRGNVYQIPVSWEGTQVLTKELISTCHSKGIQVHVWTVDDPSEMSSLIELGVDGIITDRPSILLKIAREKRICDNS